MSGGFWPFGRTIIAQWICRRQDRATQRGGSRMEGNSAYPVGLDRSQANYTPLTPLTFLERAAYVYPSRVSVIHSAQRFTWRETLSRRREDRNRSHACLRVDRDLWPRRGPCQACRTERDANPPARRAQSIREKIYHKDKKT